MKYISTWCCLPTHSVLDSSPCWICCIQYKIFVFLATQFIFREVFHVRYMPSEFYMENSLNWIFCHLGISFPFCECEMPYVTSATTMVGEMSKLERIEGLGIIYGFWTGSGWRVDILSGGCSYQGGCSEPECIYVILYTAVLHTDSVGWRRKNMLACVGVNPSVFHKRPQPGNMFLPACYAALERYMFCYFLISSVMAAFKMVLKFKLDLIHVDVW